MSSEPTLTISAITTAVGAVLAALVAFGLDLSDAQKTTILTLIAAIYPVVTALWVRQKVFAPDSAQDVSDKAHAAGAAGQAAPQVKPP